MSGQGILTMRKKFYLPSQKLKSKSGLCLTLFIFFSIFYLDHLILHLVLHCRALWCGGLPSLLSGSVLAIKPQPQGHLSYAIAISELLQYSSTLGVPDSVYARFNIISDTCHPGPCYFNSNKVFLLLSDQYRNPERGFEPGT